MDLTQISVFLPRLLEGAWITVQVTAFAAVLGLVMAMISGLGRLSERRVVRGVAGTYIEIFRGTSVLVQLFWFVFALPLVGFALGRPWSRWLDLNLLTAAVLALGLNIGSYGGEVVRGAVQAVDKGQTEAAIALNLTPTHRIRRIIFPQALVAMLPPFGNLLIELLKGSALVSVIALSDLLFVAQQIRARTGETTLVFSLVLVIYFVIAYTVTLGMRRLERRAATGLETGRQRTLMRAG
jgi:polar amino acid transport system permease protein